MKKLKIAYRKIKAKVTGVIPCTYESVSGHDFEPDGKIPEKKRIMMEMPYKCSICGKKAYYDTFLDCFVMKGE